MRRILVGGWHDLTVKVRKGSIWCWVGVHWYGRSPRDLDGDSLARHPEGVYNGHLCGLYYSVELREDSDIHVAVGWVVSSPRFVHLAPMEL